MDVRRLVGRNVKRLRDARGLTQEAFAVQTGLTQQYLSGLERGLRNPTVVTLFHISHTMGSTPAALLTPDGED